MKLFSYLLIALLASPVASLTRFYGRSQEASTFYSFENDLEGWSVNGTDLNLGDHTVNWSISSSRDIAKDGNTSLKFILDNQNDAAKIWIEKPFSVDPNIAYEVTVEYEFASRMYAGPFFDIITGVLNNHPTKRQDLYPAFKDTTWNGSDSDVGYVWQDRKYDFTARSNDQGALYVVIGIWGTWEVGHIYYFDSVRVTIAKKPEQAQFYSFENDFEGWIPKAADLQLPDGSADTWSIERSGDIWEDGAASLRFDLNSTNKNGKIWVEKAFPVEPGTKYNVSLDYSFHAYLNCVPPKFRIIAGVFRSPPQTADGLANAIQEKTTDTNCTWGWLHKTYAFTIKSKKSDVLYVAIGFWGTEKTEGVFNIDSVCVTLVPK